MRRIIHALLQKLRRTVQREPAIRFGGADVRSDWLPPVLGPGDWSSSLMAAMADRSTAWYFDRAA